MNPRIEQEETIDLLELARALLGYWYAILLAMVLLGGAMGAYNCFVEQPTYSA